MKITQDENELLMRLVEENKIPDYDPEKHVIVSQFAKKLGVSGNHARYILDNRVKKGKLAKEKVRMDNGHTAYGYFNISQKEE